MVGEHETDHYETRVEERIVEKMECRGPNISRHIRGGDTPNRQPPNHIPRFNDVR